jgi:Zn-dependent peptidase ImmA (M78 family)/transcriptional regulator with XRE-family HTH domain
MTKALINKNILVWAREQAHLSVEDVADRIGTSTTKVEAWENSEALPTFKQAQRFAEISRIPFGYLYLQTPPDYQLPITDFRTIGDHPPPPLGADFRELLNEVLRKQSWFREYRLEQSTQPLPFVGKFRLDTPVRELALDIKNVFHLQVADKLNAQNWESYLRLLSERAETAGILIMKSGIVGVNTHRPLSVEEFRGFVVSDDIAPVIFLNGKDALAAQIFTLIHEIAHIWLGVSGVSNTDIGGNYPSLDIERYCNSVAAEFLVPEEELIANWNPAESFSENAWRLCRHFKVSSVVLARRAVEKGLGEWPEYLEFYEHEQAGWIKTNQTSGGDFYRTSTVRNGKIFTKAVLERAFEGKLLLRDAGALLNVAPSKLKVLADSVYGS